MSSDYCLRGTGEGVKYYKCECPVSAYPYSKDSDCPSGYQIDHNPDKTCEANGEKRYSTCMPKSYVDCSQEGSVNGVRGLLGDYGAGYGYRADGRIVFAECRCPTSYDNYGCSTFLMSADVCVKDGKTYYKDGDCYSGCADGSLSDIDYYYKQEALRCLFDEVGGDVVYENGISINKGDESKPLCTREIDGEERTSRQTCLEMGYVYSEDECPDKAYGVARCPSNPEKVWCLNANGCQNYPVGSGACVAGARVDLCGSDGTRCVYREPDCNRNWENGSHHGSYGGSTALCCQEGWDYVNGRCEEHDCGDVSYLYPYGDKYPLREVAEGGDAGITTCKSGEKVYYGYKQCKGCKVGDTNGSNSCTDLWVPGADTPHRCVCKTEGLPFDNVTLYTQGGAGTYGTVKSCVDPDATYYGYSMCYRNFSTGMSNGKANGFCNALYCEGRLDTPYTAAQMKAYTGVEVTDKCTAAVQYNNEIPDCSTLGYDMTLGACQAQMKSLLSAEAYAKFHPLHCPYDYNQVRCWRSNCGGYNLSSPDSNFATEDCLAGIENGKAVKYMRYTGCLGKDGVTYRYDNGDCIERCDLLKYPYDTPPGTLYGEIETCYDDSLHYGYSKCHEGFGELKDGSYVPKNGRCDMIICDVNAYPYFEKSDESRGKLEICVGGTNKYYRYEKASCEANGYTYKNGACQKRFDITANSFPEIMYGDLLTYNGKDIGTIIHLPDGKDNRYVATDFNRFSGKWGRNLGTSNTFPSYDVSGKCHTKLYYDDYVNNNASHYIVRSVYEYYPVVCGKDNPYCGAGQWYVPAVSEVEYVVNAQQKYLSKALGIWIGGNPWQVYSSTPAQGGTWFFRNTWALTGDCDWCPTLIYLEFGPKKTVCD